MRLLSRRAAHPAFMPTALAATCMLLCLAQYNTTVVELQLGYNLFGTAGATSIAEGLKHCRSVTKLFMHNNKVTLSAVREHCFAAVWPTRDSFEQSLRGAESV